MNFQELYTAVLQQQFQPSKPIREARSIDIQRNPVIISSRKYNGNSATVIVTTEDVLFFTASNLKLTSLKESQLWQQSAWYQAIQQLPANTIIRGEVFVENTTIENLSLFQTWYTWHMNKLSEGNKPALASFLAFDALCYAGQPLAQLPYKDRLAFLPQALQVQRAPYTNLQETEQAAEQARREKIEGYVFWDANAASYCKLSGSNYPRGGAWKAKPSFRETFQFINFINPDPNKLIVKLGNNRMEFNCGSGLTYLERCALVAQAKSGQSITVDIAHYGIDETGKPELPVMCAILGN